MYERRAKALTPPQRDLLLRHVDGKAVLRVSETVVRRGLLRLGLISLPTYGGEAQFRPRVTRLTELGRGVLAATLASEAERLVDAGCLDADAEPIATAPMLERRPNEENATAKVLEQDQDRPENRLLALARPCQQS